MSCYGYKFCLKRCNLRPNLQKFFNLPCEQQIPFEAHLAVFPRHIAYPATQGLV